MTLSLSSDGAWPALRGCRIYRQAILPRRMINFARFPSRLPLLMWLRSRPPFRFCPPAFFCCVEPVGVRVDGELITTAEWSGII